MECLLTQLVSLGMALRANGSSSATNTTSNTDNDTDAAAAAGASAAAALDNHHHQKNNYKDNLEETGEKASSSSALTNKGQGGEEEEENSGGGQLSPTQSMETCFSSFDRDGDGFLNYAEFVVLCRALFRNERDKPYPVEPKRLRDMFDTFDINKDGLIDINEFELCWQKWIRKIVRPICALIVVDVQNDFISGSLSISNCPAKHNGEEVVEPINRLLDTVEFDSVCYTLDWHPDNHLSFFDNLHKRKIHSSSKIQNPDDAKLFDTVEFEGPPRTSQKLWPRHCVQNSWGAKIHENLKIVEGSPFIYKGTNPDLDSYSAFFDNQKMSKTALDMELSNKGVTDVFVCGIAYDVCVGATAMHSIELGYRTILIDDACRGITLDDIVSTKNMVEEGYGTVVHSEEVKAMVSGRDRRPELGFKLAMELRTQIKQLEQENRI